MLEGVATVEVSNCRTLICIFFFSKNGHKASIFVELFIPWMQSLCVYKYMDAVVVIRS